MNFSIFVPAQNSAFPDAFFEKLLPDFVLTLCMGKKQGGVPLHAARTKPILSYEAKLLTGQFAGRLFEHPGLLFSVPGSTGQRQSV